MAAYKARPRRSIGKEKTNKQSASQPASKPIRAIDGPPRPKNVQWRTHIMGAPMLSKEMLAVATRDMRSLHDSMLVLEDRILKDRSAGYPAFVAKLPGGKGFVVESAGQDMLILGFADIFDMFHQRPLHHSFVRLYAISMTMKIIREITPGIAIADPYYMRDIHLTTTGDRLNVSKYLQNLFQACISKDSVLLPYIYE